MPEVSQNRFFTLCNHSFYCCNFIIRLRFTLFEGNCSNRAIANACTKTVAVEFTHHSRFSFNHLQSTFVATTYTSPATIAERLIYFYYCSFHIYPYPLKGEIKLVYFISILLMTLL